MEWWQYIVAVASVLAAGRLIWTKAIQPIIAAADAIHDAAPVLLEIAKEWDGNGHSTLGDEVRDIKSGIVTLQQGQVDAQQANLETQHELNNVKQVMLAAPWLTQGDAWRLMRKKNQQD